MLAAMLAATNHIVFLIIVFGVVMAIAMSGGSINTTVSIISKWFERKRAMAVAIVAAGAPMGGLILVPLSSYLIELAGWRATWAVLGVMVLTLAVPLAYFVMREQPQDLGLMPDGDARQTSADGKVIRVVKRAPLESERWVTCFGTFPMWQLSGAYFVCGFTTALISAHFVPFAIEKGYSQSMAASAFGVMSGLNVVGVMMAGALGDRFGTQEFIGACVPAARGGIRDVASGPGPIGIVELLAGGGLLVDCNGAVDYIADGGRLRTAQHRHSGGHRFYGAPDWRSHQHPACGRAARRDGFL